MSMLVRQVLARLMIRRSFGLMQVLGRSGSHLLIRNRAALACHLQPDL